MIKIDGMTFDVPVIKLSRKADFLDKFAKRTEDGGLQRKLIGVYFNYQLQLGIAKDKNEYSRFWNKLTEPVEFHTVVVPDADGDYTFTAYFSNVGDEMLIKTQERNYWQNLTVNFTAQVPARR
ncbi:MAG TPA: hypothetical protein DHU59_13535 [Clostridiales bacterium]|nr:hypothetical protein [Clostridiales bacterium]